jgi:hypothetical protein
LQNSGIKINVPVHAKRTKNGIRLVFEVFKHSHLPLLDDGRRIQGLKEGCILQLIGRKYSTSL